MNLLDLGNLVKQKYQEYANIDSVELGSKILKKFPEYSQFISSPTAYAVSKVVQSEPVQEFAKSAIRDYPREGASIGLNFIGNNKFVPTTPFEKTLFGSEPIYSWQARKQRGSNTLQQYGVPSSVANPLSTAGTGLMIGATLGDVSPVGPEDALKGVSKVAKNVPFQGFDDLTLKTLEKLKGMGKVSKQHLLNLTNQGGIKQAERDVIRKVADSFDEAKIPAQEFADKVKTELLPLETTGTRGAVWEPERGISTINPYENYVPESRYENITLPEELRGNVTNYGERIYESPIKTSAGSVHFEHDGYPNYFAHTRIEDMADNQTRRVIEVQSDLMQKGRLDEEARYAKDMYEMNKNIPYRNQDNRLTELNKLSPYRNTWHERIIKEEVKKAAQDGKTVLQFPTGETAMKIEGLGDTSQWFIEPEMTTQEILDTPVTQIMARNRQNTLQPNMLKTGMEISQFNNMGDNKWIITDVLGDGKFKAIKKANKGYLDGSSIEIKKLDGKNTYYADTPSGVLADGFSIKEVEKKVKDYVNQLKETFDISGKVDSNNPIYKFYEKDVQKFLNREYPGTQKVVDDNGVSWFQVNVKPEQAKYPVTAFQLGAGVGLGTATAIGMNQNGPGMDIGQQK